MGGVLFSKPSTPDLPPPPKEDPREAEESRKRVEAARRREAERLKKRGVAANMETGATGVAGAANVHKNTLG